MGRLCCCQPTTVFPTTQHHHPFGSENTVLQTPSNPKWNPRIWTLLPCFHLFSLFLSHFRTTFFAWWRLPGARVSHKVVASDGAGFTLEVGASARDDMQKLAPSLQPFKTMYPMRKIITVRQCWILLPEFNHWKRNMDLNES